MKIKQTAAAVFAATCIAFSVNAQTPESKLNNTAPVEVIAQKIKTAYPNTTFTDIHPSVISGLYEVVMGQNVAYTDSAARYFIFGRVFTPMGSFHSKKKTFNTMRA